MPEKMYENEINILILFDFRSDIRMLAAPAKERKKNACHMCCFMHKFIR